MKLRAVRAKRGDALLMLGDSGGVVMVDGGPSGVYRSALSTVLKMLDEGGLDPPLIDLLVVSHIDADHVAGILDLTHDLREAVDEKRRPIVRIREAWHNSFSDLVLHDQKPGPEAENAAAALASAVDTDLPTMRHLVDSQLVLASVGQGRRLRIDLEDQRIRTNGGFADGLVAAGHRAASWSRRGISIDVIGPTSAEIADLRTKWSNELPEILRKEQEAQLAAARRLDTSITNLSSIVFAATADKKTALFTGDARGDNILSWLEASEYMEEEGNVHFDVLKLPHHGSDRSVTQRLIERVTANHYVVSGDGSHTNPDPETLELLFTSRPELDFTVVMTYGPDELKSSSSYVKHNAGPRLDEVLSGPGRMDTLRYPSPGETHIDVDL